MSKRKPLKPPKTLWELLTPEERAALQKENAKDCENFNRRQGEAPSLDAPGLTHSQFIAILTEQEAILGEPIRPAKSPNAKDDPDDIPF